MLGIWSCGSRKVNKSNTEIKEKSEITIVDSVKVAIKTDSNTEIQTNEFTIEPIDSIKPIIIIDSQGKKTSYLNARIKHKHETSRNKTLKNELVQISTKTNIKAEKQTKQALKQVERKESIITSLWWLWILIILVITYYVSRKFIPFRI